MDRKDCPFFFEDGICSKAGVELHCPDEGCGIVKLKNDTHKPDRYEVLPGIQAWDILKPICNRFNGVIAAYIFNIGKYFLRIGMKDDVKKELMKMREYIDKAIEEVSNGNN